MTTKKRYTAKSLAGATRRVRELEDNYKRLDILAQQFMLERNSLAKLAAKGPCFHNPLEVFAVEEVRDRVLREVWRLNPDGTPVK